MPKAFLLTNKRYKIWKQIKETFREEQRRQQLIEQQRVNREQQQQVITSTHHHHHHQHHFQHHHHQQVQGHHDHYHPVHYTDDSDETRDRSQLTHAISSTDYSQYTNITDEDTTNPPIPSPAVSPTSSTSSKRSSTSSSTSSEESDGGYSYTTENRPVSPSIEFGIGGCRQPHISFLYDLMTSNHPSNAPVFKPGTEIHQSAIDQKRYAIVQDLSMANGTPTYAPIHDMMGMPVAPLNLADESGDTHVCIDCGKRYSTSSNLARHRQTHRASTDKKARKCPHCEKMYVSMPAYSMHVRTHNQGCECKYCGKRFSRPWLLQGHIRTHTGEKPFSCSQCGKSFADKSNLRAHVQTHSSEKPYVCGRCGKAFALKSYLYKHEESSCMRGQRFKQ